MLYTISFSSLNCTFLLIFSCLEFAKKMFFHRLFPLYQVYIILGSLRVTISKSLPVLLVALLVGRNCVRLFFVEPA